MFLWKVLFLSLKRTSRKKEIRHPCIFKTIIFSLWQHTLNKPNEEHRRRKVWPYQLKSKFAKDDVLQSKATYFFRRKGFNWTPRKNVRRGFQFQAFRRPPTARRSGCFTKFLKKDLKTNFELYQALFDKKHAVCVVQRRLPRYKIVEKWKKVLVCPPRQNCGRETLPLNLLERQNRGDKNWPQKETSFSFKARRCSEAANFHLANKENTRYKKGFKTLKKVLSYNRQAWSREDLYHGTLKDKPRFFCNEIFSNF